MNLHPEIRVEIDECLSEIPVKLGEIAKRLGIRVFLSTLPRGISCQVVREGNQFVIRINRHEAKDRQRFGLAHQLAHVLLHKKLVIEDGGWSENILFRSGRPLDIEYEANRLAFDLVLPSARLSEATSEVSGPMTGEIIKDLASRFRVSPTVMEIKLQVI